jgi:circadian clock protein KaiB
MQPVGLAIISSVSTGLPAGEFWRTALSGGLLTKYSLKLFVTGASSRTGAAIANLNRICEQELGGDYQLEIIDVLEHPDLAEDEKILATPTLIKSLPLPLRRVIGDLSNTERVLLGLEVHSQEDGTAPGGAPQ